MAHHKSAKKSIRKTVKESAVNRNRRSRMRTFVKKVEESIAAGDHTVAMEALKAAQPEIMRAAQKGIIKPNTASRKISRLNSRIKSLAAAS